MLKKLSLGLLAILLVSSLVLFSCGKEPVPMGGDKVLVWSLADWFTDGGAAWDGTGATTISPVRNSGSPTISTANGELKATDRANNWDGFGIDFDDPDIFVLPLVNYSLTVKGKTDQPKMVFGQPDSPYAEIAESLGEGDRDFELHIDAISAVGQGSVNIQSSGSTGGYITITSIEIWGPDIQPETCPACGCMYELEDCSSCTAAGCSEDYFDSCSSCPTCSLPLYKPFKTVSVAPDTSAAASSIGTKAEAAMDGSSVVFTYTGNNQVGIIPISEAVRADLAKADRISFKIAGSSVRDGLFINETSQFRHILGVVDTGQDWNATGANDAVGTFGNILTGTYTLANGFDATTGGVAKDYFFVLQIRDNQGAKIKIDSIEFTLLANIHDPSVTPCPDCGCFFSLKGETLCDQCTADGCGDDPHSCKECPYIPQPAATVTYTALDTSWNDKTVAVAAEEGLVLFNNTDITISNELGAGEDQNGYIVKHNQGYDWNTAAIAVDFGTAKFGDYASVSFDYEGIDGDFNYKSIQLLASNTNLNNGQLPIGALAIETASVATGNVTVPVAITINIDADKVFGRGMSELTQVFIQFYVPASNTANYAISNIRFNPVTPLP